MTTYRCLVLSCTGVDPLAALFSPFSGRQRDSCIGIACACVVAAGAHPDGYRLGHGQEARHDLVYLSEGQFWLISGEGMSAVLQGTSRLSTTRSSELVSYAYMTVTLMPCNPLQIC